MSGRIAIKIALLLIAAVPASYVSSKWLFAGVQNGLFKRRIPMGADEALTGWKAASIGVYSLCLLIALWSSICYVIVFWGE
jgi:hypothetical protein